MYDTYGNKPKEEGYQKHENERGVKYCSQDQLKQSQKQIQWTAE